MERKAIEFFSGIGGLHYGLLAADQTCTIVESFDMNELANSVYSLNFSKRPNNKAIDHLKLNEIEKHKAQIWLLSPPCQPFTRGGKYLDDIDPRTKPLIHLMNILKKLEYKPEVLFLENVYNFERSNTRKKLVELLCSLGYQIKEYLVSPTQLGIPNDRLRYYLAARKNRSSNVDLDKIKKYHLIDEKEACIREFSAKSRGFADKIVFGNVESRSSSKNNCFSLERFLENDNTAASEQLAVSIEKIEKRNNFNFDIVSKSSRKSATFTKAYGSKHFIGSGSLLATNKTNVETTAAVEKLQSTSVADTSKLETVKGLNLRFFSPLEVARLMCFPVSGGVTNSGFNLGQTETLLKFPSELSTRQQHQLLGNSVNVLVVSSLLFEVLNEA